MSTQYYATSNGGSLMNITERIEKQEKQIAVLQTAVREAIRITHFVHPKDQPQALIDAESLFRASLAE